MLTNQIKLTSSSPSGKSSLIFITIIAAIIGIWFSPLIIGLVVGYVIGYYYELKKREEPPTIFPLPAGMGHYIIITTLIIAGLSFLGVQTLSSWIDHQYQTFFHPVSGTIQAGKSPQISQTVIRIIYALSTVGTIFLFVRWRKGVLTEFRERFRYGSARFATRADLDKFYYTKDPNAGIYIGGENYYYQSQFHVFSCAGTRSGKGTNLLIPNLLRDFDGSGVVIDPKGVSILSQQISKNPVEEKFE
ncbi:MAG: type IV secretory system conjugative DNA transfer family protein [Bacteroidia bacterium]